MIKGIVCVDENWGIGKKNGLLFRLKEDMKYFQQKTSVSGRNIVVMGENTLLSFPNSKPLKGRVNIVMCPPGHEYEGCICMHDFNELINLIRVLAEQFTVWIIGGGMMYRSMLPYYDEVYVTKVAAKDPDATVFFPNLDELSEFKIISESDPVIDNSYNIKFLVYGRV